MLQMLHVHIVGFLMIFFSIAYQSISSDLDGVVSRSFDQLFSIGILVIALIVICWYHWKDMKYHRSVIEKLADNNNQKSNELKELSKTQAVLSREQIESNKQLREAVKEFKELIRESK